MEERPAVDNLLWRKATSYCHSLNPHLQGVERERQREKELKTDRERGEKETRLDSEKEMSSREMDSDRGTEIETGLQKVT